MYTGTHDRHARRQQWSVRQGAAYGVCCLCHILLDLTGCCSVRQGGSLWCVLSLSHPLGSDRMLFSKTGGQLMVCADCLCHILLDLTGCCSVRQGGQLMVCADCLSHPLGSDRMLFSKTGGQLMVCAVSVTSSGI